MDQVEEVKQKTDIVSVIGSYLDLKKAGRNYKTRCPFHAEKTPSFMVSPELQVFKCFGCGESGDVISFLQKYEGMEFYEALKFLAEKAGIKLNPLNSSQLGEKEKIININKNVMSFYSYILHNHKMGKTALSYLTRERGLKIDTIKKFDLGYAPEREFLLSDLLNKRRQINPKDLVTAGVVYPKSGRYADRFSGRVIFPLFDHRGNPIGFAGRVLPGNEKEGVGKYINSPDTPAYHKSKVLYGLNITRGEVKRKNLAVVVEGELDMISCYQAGVENCVAIKGTAVTKEQVSLLSRLTSKLVLALDADIAGDMAAKRGIAIAQEEGMEIGVVVLKGYKDPDEMARKNPQGFIKAIEKPLGVWDFLIDSVFEKYDVNTGEGKQRISREVIPTLAQIPDRIVQSHYILKTSEKLGVPEEAVEEEVNKILGKKINKKEEIQQESVEEKPRRQVLEDRLLTLILLHKIDMFKKKEIVSLIKQRPGVLLYQEYEKFMQKRKKFDLSDFASFVPKELFDYLSKIALADTERFDEDPSRVEKEFSEVLRQIRIFDAKERAREYVAEIRKQEDAGDEEKLVKVKKKFAEEAKKINELEEK